jgi:hypothetical protein
MQGFWLTLAGGLAALLAVSVLVALVEFLRGAPAHPPAPTEPRPPRLDVNLDTLAQAPVAPVAPPLAAADQETRRQALDEVLRRLTVNPADAPWIETTPMVLAARQDSSASA